MKKIFLLFSFLCTLLLAQQLPAQEGADGACCPEEPKESPVGPCYCMYVKYIPQYYNQYRCVQEPKCYTEKCYRWVPKYYDKQCCRYVPQYYTQTCCKYEQECYDVPKTTYCTKQVCDKCVKYIPKYYYKCIQNPCGAAAGADSGPSYQDRGEGFQGAGFHGGGSSGCGPSGCCPAS